jgi:hypothetical protein
MRKSMTDKEAGDAYRLAQAQKMLDLFEEAHGRAATSTEEISKWVASDKGKAALAYDSTPDGKIIPG